MIRWNVDKLKCLNCLNAFLFPVLLVNALNKNKKINFYKFSFTHLFVQWQKILGEKNIKKFLQIKKFYWFMEKF